MNRLYCALIVVLLSCGAALAAPIDLDLTDFYLPNAKEGAIISFKQEGVETCITTTVLAYPKEAPAAWGQVYLDIGGAPAINEPVVGVTWKPNLDKLEISFPYGKYLDVSIGPYVGFEINEYRNNNEEDWTQALDYGLLVSIVDIKF